jgi:cell shape-determining protein MreD
MQIASPATAARWKILFDLLEILVVVTIQAAWVTRLPAAFRPDLVFLVLAYQAFTRPLPVALAAALVAGLALDAMTATPFFGLATASKLVTVAAIHFLAESIWHHKRVALFLLLICAGALCQNVLFAFLAGLAGVQGLPYLLLNGVLAALFTTILGYVLVGIWYYSQGRFGR